MSDNDVYEYKKIFEDETACVIKLKVISLTLPFKVISEQYPIWFTPTIKSMALNEAFTELCKQYALGDGNE